MSRSTSIRQNWAYCLCGFCLAFDRTLWIVGSGQCRHRRRADAVPAHVHLLDLGERLAVDAVTDDVVVREALVLRRFGYLASGVIL